MTRRAFTLIEVLIAVVLLAALFAAFATFAWGVAHRRQFVVDRLEQERAASVLIDQVDRLLPTTFVADAGGAGVVGGQDWIRVRGRSVDLTPPVGQGAGSDVAGVEIRTDDRGVSLTVLPGGETERLAYPGKVRIRYFDGRLWVGSFDSAKSGSLPAAVEIVVWNLATEENPQTPATPGPSDEPGAGGDDRAMAGEAQPPEPKEEDERLKTTPPVRRLVIAIPDAAPGEVAP